MSKRTLEKINRLDALQQKMFLQTLSPSESAELEHLRKQLAYLHGIADKIVDEILHDEKERLRK